MRYRLLFSYGWIIRRPLCQKLPEVKQKESIEDILRQHGLVNLKRERMVLSRAKLQSVRR